MTTINISLPDSMQTYIEEQVAQGGYSTVSEYFRELILKDQKRPQVIRDLIELATYITFEPLTFY